MNSKFLPAGIIALFFHSLILLISPLVPEPDNTDEYIKYQVSLTQRIEELPVVYQEQKELIPIEKSLDNSPEPEKELITVEEISSNHIVEEASSSEIAEDISIEYNAEESGFISDTGSIVAGEPVIAIELEDYNRVLAEINQKIRSNIVYPRMARRRNIEGTVTLSFELQENGVVEEINVLASSGYSVLDNAAYNLLERISPFEFDLIRAMNLKVNIIYKFEDG